MQKECGASITYNAMKSGAGSPVLGYNYLILNIFSYSKAINIEPFFVDSIFFLTILGTCTTFLFHLHVFLVVVLISVTISKGQTYSYS